MPRTRPAYPEEFRREAVQMVRAGRSTRGMLSPVQFEEQSLSIKNRN